MNKCGSRTLPQRPEGLSAAISLHKIHHQTFTTGFNYDHLFNSLMKAACCDYWGVFLSLNCCVRQRTHTLSTHAHANGHRDEEKWASGSGPADAIWCPVSTLSNSQLHTWEAASPATVVGPPTALPPAPTLLTAGFLSPNPENSAPVSQRGQRASAFLTFRSY